MWFPIKRKNHPFIDTWALPGGFANPDESVDETALRELKEETGVDGIYLEQLGLFSKPDRDPRAWVMTCAYIAVAKKEELSLKAADDAADAKWFKAEYEIKDEQFILKLSSDECILSAVLDMHVRKTPFGITTRFEIVDSGGIAFDHAEIIAKGLLRLAGRPYSHFNKNQK